jgi:hypothetical protein
MKIAFVGGSPTAGLGTQAGQSYLSLFKSWMGSLFQAHTYEVMDLSMVKATARVTSRCSALNADDADVVVIELLHDEGYSNNDVDSVPGASYVSVPLLLSRTAAMMHMHDLFKLLLS